MIDNSVLQMLTAMTGEDEFKPDSETEVEVNGEKYLQIMLKTKSGKTVKMQEPGFREQWSNLGIVERVAKCVVEFTVGNETKKRSDYLPEDWVKQVELHFPAREAITLIRGWSYFQEKIFR